MGKKKAVGKSLRFEIFARDGFVCQYCGRRPPDVVLELDHIHPQAKGGDNDPLNLITSCADCNRGKRDKVLAEIPRRPDADLKYLEAQQEIVEVERYMKAKEQRDRAMFKLHGCMQELWADELSEESLPNATTFSAWLRRYGPDELEYAITRTAPKFHAGQFGRSAGYYQTLNVSKYISGILRSRAEQSGESDG